MSQEWFQVGERRVDLTAKRVLGPGGASPLTDMEVRLLAYLYERRGETVGREELLREVWRYDPIVADRTRAPSLTVGRLRPKLEADPRSPVHLLTVRGEGYRLVVGEVDDAEALAQRGEALYRSSSGQESEANIRALEALLPQLEVAAADAPPTLRARLLLLRAQSSALSGADAPVEGLWQLAETLEDPGLALRCAAHAVSDLQRRGAPSAALSAAEGWLDRFGPPRDHDHVFAAAELRLAYVNLLIPAGRLDDAERFGREGMRLAQRSGARQMEGSYHGRAGVVAACRGHDPRALLHFTEAARCFVKAGSLRDLILLMANVGVHHYGERRLIPARNILEQVVGWMSASGFTRGAAYARLNLATVLLSLGDLDEAARRASASLVWLEASGESNGRFLATLLVARVDLERGRWPEAAERLTTLGFLADQLDSARFRGHVWRYEGWLAQRRGRDGAASALYRRALPELRAHAREGLALGVTCLWASALEAGEARRALLVEAAAALGADSERAEAVTAAALALDDYDARRTRELIFPWVTPA